MGEEITVKLPKGVTPEQLEEFLLTLKPKIPKGTPKKCQDCSRWNPKTSHCLLFSGYCVNSLTRPYFKPKDPNTTCKDNNHCSMDFFSLFGFQKV